MRTVRQLLTSSCSQMTWYALGRRSPLEISQKKQALPSRSEEALSEFVRVVVPERERPLCPTHTSYCIPDAYGRWEFVITPTSGRRTDDSRIAETRILRNSKTLKKCNRVSATSAFLFVQYNYASSCKLKYSLTRI